MSRERTTGLASMALGLGIALNAVLGPLVFGVVRLRESANMETQLLGGELTALFLAAPLACIAGVLWWRRNRLAPIVGIGPAGFALYTYVQYVLVPDYSRYPGNNERFFPLYLGLVMLGGWIVWRAWDQLWGGHVAPLTTRLTKVSGVFLIAFNGAFALAWIASVASIYISGPSAEYSEHPTAFWLIRLMDLGFVIPFGVATGVGLLRNPIWATRNLYAFAGTEALLACAVSGMAIRMWIVGDPSASPVMLVIFTSAAVAFVTLFGVLIANVARHHGQPWIALRSIPHSRRAAGALPRPLRHA